MEIHIQCPIPAPSQRSFHTVIILVTRPCVVDRACRVEEVEIDAEGRVLGVEIDELLGDLGGADVGWRGGFGGAEGVGDDVEVRWDSDQGSSRMQWVGGGGDAGCEEG